MARILFSFLGAAYYSLETYSFGDDPKAQHTTTFFPQALIAEQRRRNVASGFDKVVLCGTSTSGWHAVAAALGADVAEPDPARGAPPSLSLSEIDAFSAPLGQVLKSNVIAQQIGFARDTADQIAFLQMVAAHVARHDAVHFDITHGFRHQPVVALVAALAVERLREANVEAIWYGAVQMKDRERKLSPVIRLDGLLTALDWLDALSVFDATGDMTRFGPLIDREAHTDIAGPLAETSFQERILQTKSIRRVADTVLDALSVIEGGASALVRPVIEKRLAWTRTAARIEEGFDLALRLAQNGSEQRALTLAFETAVRKIAIEAGIDTADTRRQIDPRTGNTTPLSSLIGRAAGSISRPGDGSAARAFLDLKALRNAIVHVDNESRKSEPMLVSAKAFQDGFRRLLLPLRQPVTARFAAEVRQLANH